MKANWRDILCGFAVISGLSLSAAANKPGKHKDTASASVQQTMSDDDMRLEGERRFQANCGRCHQSPHKFPPRMMFTIERHMRVRALITEEDMRLIVRYLNQ